MGQRQSVKSGSQLPYIPISYPSPFTRQTVFLLQRHFRIFVSIIKSNPTITAKAGVITAYTLIRERITSVFANATEECRTQSAKRKTQSAKRICGKVALKNKPSQILQSVKIQADADGYIRFAFCALHFALKLTSRKEQQQ